MGGIVRCCFVCGGGAGYGRFVNTLPNQRVAEGLQFAGYGCELYLVRLQKGGASDVDHEEAEAELDFAGALGVTHGCMGLAIAQEERTSGLLAMSDSIPHVTYSLQPRTIAIGMLLAEHYLRGKYAWGVRAVDSKKLRPEHNAARATQP